MAFRIHNGSSFTFVDPKIHNGSGFVDVQTGRIHNGSTWVEFFTRVVLDWSSIIGSDTGQNINVAVNYSGNLSAILTPYDFSGPIVDIIKNNSFTTNPTTVAPGDLIRFQVSNAMGLMGRVDVYKDSGSTFIDDFEYFL